MQQFSADDLYTGKPMYNGDKCDEEGPTEAESANREPLYGMSEREKMG
jgi:hypothetical protein